MQTAKLLDLDYYVDKVSLAMQNDAIFMKQIEDFVLLMNECDEQIDRLEFALQTLLYDIISGNATEIAPYAFTDTLEKIASIFNITRRFVVDFKDPETNVVDTLLKSNYETFKHNSADDHLTTNIDLTDNQLRLLIYCAIMKNSYDGSYEMLSKIYATVCKFVSVEIHAANSWHIYQVTDYVNVENVISATPATARCIFAFNNYTFTEDNIQLSQYFTLFFAGFLTIQSAGIYYYYGSTDLASILYWSPESGEPQPFDQDNYNWSNYPTGDVRRWM